MKISDKKIKRKIIFMTRSIEFYRELLEEKKQNLMARSSGISDLPRGSETSDPTAKTTIDILENKNIQDLEYILKMFDVTIKNLGYTYKKIYEKGFQEYARTDTFRNADEIAEELGLSVVTYRKFKENLIYQLGIAWGLIKIY